MLAFVAVGHSQIVLEEAKITSDPTSMKVDPVKNVYVLTIPEKSFGGFEKDPLAFVRERIWTLRNFLQTTRKEDSHGSKSPLNPEKENYWLNMTTKEN